MTRKLVVLARAAWSYALLGGIVWGIWWLTNGGAHRARFWWTVAALFLTPIVGYLAFLGWIAVSWIREGKRNVREAELRRQLAGPDAPAPYVKRSPPSRRKHKR